MKNHYYRLIMTLVLLCTSASVFACRFVADTRPIVEQMNQQPIIFIGTVIQGADKGSDGVAIFKIETHIKGVANTQQTYEVNVGKSSCGRSFATGERWLFAGEAVFSPSVLLDSKDGVTLTRMDDSKLNLKHEWQQCKADSDCTTVFYSCASEVAVNVSSRDIAEKELWDKHGDPRTINCVVKPIPDLYILPTAVCRQNSCSIMQIQF